METEEKNKNEKKITIKVDGEEWQQAIEKALQNVSKKIVIDGFRRGKAPRKMVIKQYGEQNLRMDAADIVVQDGYEKMILKNPDLEIVSRPEGNLIHLGEDGVEFEFTVTLKPEVQLGQYKNLGVTKESAEATTEEIEAAILRLRKKFAEEVLKEGEVSDGNVAIIDFEGFHNGTAFAGGKGENFSLTIGSHTFIPGFEEQLIGMKKGEEKEIEVTFPEDYHEESLKGEKATFKVKVNEVKEEVIPEVNEAFFEDLGEEGITDLESLQNHLKNIIEEQKKVEVENHYIDALLEAAAKNTKVDIPEVMITEELDRMVKQQEENMGRQGISLDLFYQLTHSTEADLREQLKGEAQKRVLYRLMLEEIAKKEQLEIDDNEAQEEAERLADQYGMETKKFLKEFGGLETVKYDLKVRKALEMLKEDK